MASESTTPPASCPTCGQPMRRELDGMRVPPMPQVFWFCTNSSCADGNRNRLFRGG